MRTAVFAQDGTDNGMFFCFFVFQSVIQAYPSAPNRSRTFDLPIASSDALPLSYRRLVVARTLN